MQMQMQMQMQEQQQQQQGNAGVLRAAQNDKQKNKCHRDRGVETSGDQFSVTWFFGFGFSLGG
jgi:hypothetical protein